MLSFLKLLGSMKAIVEAKVAACFINLIANEHCCPNGGFPITNVFSLVLETGFHFKKSALIIDGSSGCRSIAIEPEICLENEPEPAEGSIIVSYSDNSSKDMSWEARIGFV